MKYNNIGKITKNSVLLTGATGLIGSYLLKVLIENDNTVLIAAREKNGLSGNERVEKILKFWDGNFVNHALQKIQIINADVSASDLSSLKGILLKNRTDLIVHCAANTSLQASLSELKKTNVFGLENILNLGEFLHKKGATVRIAYLSTAYVCGNYNGRFHEADLAVNQKFNTDYEESKFEAEKLVDKFRERGLWVDIFRPSLVVGEYSTGKTPVFQSLLQAVQLLSKEIFEKFPAKNVPANIVNVDEAALAILSLIKLVEKKNQNYHIFSSEYSYFEDIIKISSRFMGYKMPQLVKYDRLVQDSLTDIQKKLLKNTIYAFNPYVRLDAGFTNKLLNDLGFYFSKIDEEMIRRLLKFAVSVKFKNFSE